MPTFEGMVRAADLLRLYPKAQFEDNTQTERMARIMDSAFAKRLSECLLPNTEVLVARLTRLGRELAEAKSHAAPLQRYKMVFDRLQAKLMELEATTGEEARKVVSLLQDWLRNELEDGLPNTEYPQLLITRGSVLRIMAAHIRILPSGHEFLVEGSDTLLEAALTAGLALNYGCSNGNCGLCKARVLSGEVKKVRHHDYRLTEAEKGMGYMLLCSYTPVTDLEIETTEATGAQDIPIQQIDTKVTGIERPMADTMLLQLQTPRTKRLRFLAGQYLKLQLGNAWDADLPIASCPCDDRNLQFHIPRTTGSPFSDCVFNQLRKGETVSIEGPKGNFVLREDSPHSLIFIAYDTCFAPIKSLIEHAMSLDVAEAIYLYWVASREGGHYLENLCRSWADALDKFHYALLVASPVGPASHGRSEDWGEIMARIAEDHPSLIDFDVYVAGSEGLITAAERLLPERGLPRDQLYLGYIV